MGGKKKALPGFLFKRCFNVILSRQLYICDYLKKKIQWPKQLLWCSHQQTTGKHSTALDFFFLLLLMQLHWRSSVFALHNLITEIKKPFLLLSVVATTSSLHRLQVVHSHPCVALIRHNGRGGGGSGRGHCLRFHWLHTSDGAIRFPRLPVNISRGAVAARRTIFLI